MDVYGHVQLCGSQENRPEAFVIDNIKTRAWKNHCADEAKLINAAAQFVRCGRGIGRRQGRERGEAIGLSLHHIRQIIVGITSERDCQACRKLLDTGCRNRQHLEIDAHLIHAGQPLLPDIQQPAICCRFVAPAGDGLIIARMEQGFAKLGWPSVLFDRDHTPNPIGVFRLHQAPAKQRIRVQAVAALAVMVACAHQLRSSSAALAPGRRLASISSIGNCPGWSICGDGY